MMSQNYYSQKLIKRLKHLQLKTICYVFIHRQKNAGYTLIEMIVVVLMVGILAAIVSPTWLAFVNRQRVNKANDAVFAALQEAQREAKKKKLSYSVSLKHEDGIPKILIHNGKIPPASGWKNLGEDMGFKSGQIALYTNLDTKFQGDGSSANKKASTKVDYQKSGSGTITFDYMGTLPDVNLGTAGGSSDQLGFKIAVAIPKTGSYEATNVRRCVILDTLIGGMRTAKDKECE
jgi:prepilin-type N-terminal cleavage/methylation domain-containing protein